MKQLQVSLNQGGREQPTLSQRIADLINYGFALRDVLHKQHLVTSSYARHVSLEQYYTDLIKNLDQLAEVYQGRYHDLNFQGGNQFVLNYQVDAAILLQNFLRFLDQDRVFDFGFVPELQTILDEIKLITDRAYYRLGLN